MAVLSRHKLFAVTVLTATLAGLSPAWAVGNIKAPPASYWRGGYFGPAFALSKIRNTYNPAVPLGFRKLKANGKLIGLIGGYNFLRKDLMWGIEGDIGAGSIFNDDLSYIATLRGRIGKPFGDALPYITGGFAVAGVKSKSGNSPYKASNAQPGFVIGGGFEKVLAHAITGRLEYTYGRFFGQGNSSGPRVRLKNLQMLRASIAIHLRD